MIDSVFITFGCNAVILYFRAVDLKWPFFFNSSISYFKKVMQL